MISRRQTDWRLAHELKVMKAVKLHLYATFYVHYQPLKPAFENIQSVMSAMAFFLLWDSSV